jgi:hypothetical protein
MGLFELIDRVRCAQEGHIGPFDTDLGLFRYSLRGISEFERNRVNLPFYLLPSADPDTLPGELAGYGRYNFEVEGLLKKIPEKRADGTTFIRTAPIEVGDTVELYVEAFDKVAALDKTGKPILDTNRTTVPDLARPAGYTREARRKIVVSEDEARVAIRQRDEARRRLDDQLDEIRKNQEDVFTPKKK